MYVRVVQPITKYRNLLMVLDVSLIKDVSEFLTSFLKNYDSLYVIILNLIDNEDQLLLNLINFFPFVLFNHTGSLYY